MSASVKDNVSVYDHSNICFIKVGQMGQSNSLFNSPSKRELKHLVINEDLDFLLLLFFFSLCQAYNFLDSYAKLAHHEKRCFVFVFQKLYLEQNSLWHMHEVQLFLFLVWCTMSVPYSLYPLYLLFYSILQSTPKIIIHSTDALIIWLQLHIQSLFLKKRTFKVQ